MEEGGKGRKAEGNVARKNGQRDAMLLALKIKAGARSQTMWIASIAEKGKEKFSPKLLERNMVLPYFQPSETVIRLLTYRNVR